MKSFKVYPYSFVLWILVPLWVLYFLIAYPPQALDFALSHLFYSAGVWPWRDNTSFSFYFYRMPKIIPIVLAVLSVGGLVLRFIKPGRITQQTACRCFYVLLAMTASALSVSFLKETTGVYCPWPLTAFGGAEAFQSPSLSLLPQPGRCWPAGHAGTGFTLFALYFALRDRTRILSRFVLFAVIAFGSFCTWVRIMQGAHFFSHGLVTMVLDWLICAGIYVVLFDRKAIQERIKGIRDGVSLRSFCTVMPLIWAGVFCMPFYRELMKTAGVEPSGIVSSLLLTIFSFAAFYFIALSIISFLLLLPFKVFKVLMIILTLIGACSVTAYLFYGVKMTPDMIRNFLATDQREAFEYWSLSLAWVFVLTALPGLILSLKLSALAGSFSCFKRVAVSVLGLLFGLSAILAQFQSFSVAMRNDKSLRYLIAPVNIVYSTLSTTLRDNSPEAAREIIVVDHNPHQTVKSVKPTLMVVVVGETVRSANWQLAGYHRETNPKLSGLPIVNISKVQACGTSTDVSLPCMMSRIGRRDYDRDRIINEEALPAHLQRAGFSVTWVENQSGCKGVCRDVPTHRAMQDAQLCTSDECLDGVLVMELKHALHALKSGDSAVLFLHMMGSHGPAYARRSSKDEAVFGQMCTDTSFKSCSPATIRAAYDASIRYTDRVLADMIKSLSRYPDFNAALIYVSDHGESLGENGLFLHGTPYPLAPDEQLYVPMLLWMNQSFEQTFSVSRDAIEENIKQTVTHDHLYHTILGMLKVQSETYDPKWDLSKK